MRLETDLDRDKKTRRRKRLNYEDLKVTYRKKGNAKKDKKDLRKSGLL